jgi:sigma-B regulation protein RsbU (phosphoserine phosphatase)
LTQAPTQQATPELDLDAVVAPFRGLEPGLCLAIEAADGTPIASTSLAPPATDAVTREIPGGALSGGRIRIWGGASGGGLGPAVAESLAAALAAAPVTDLAVAAQRAADARRLEEELAHGRRLQRSFVSLRPPDVPGYDIAAHYEAAREVGGDFFDLFRLRKRGRPLSVTIADVTGKGIAAALLMAFVRPLLHAAIDHTTGPAQALERTNQILVEERRSSLFITALVGRLDLPTGRLVLANAGHEPPLIVRADGSPPVWLDGAGPLVGAFERVDVPVISTTLEPGDLALLYTDGITDARSPSGERFDEWRMLESLEASRGGTAEQVIAQLSDTVCAFQEPSAPADDITIVAIRRLPAT